MTVSVTEAGPFERLVAFRLSDEDIAAAKAVTARRLAKDLKLKGFRPGKAPLPVIEATVGKDRFRSETIDDAVPVKLTEILRETELRPAVTPRLEKLADADGGVDVEVRVTLWPTVDLPDFKGRRIEVPSPTVSAGELENQLQRMLAQYATVEDVERPAELGDFVSIDVSTAIAGEEVPEATATDLLYEVGSGMFIDGIDDHLPGVAAGDSFSFDGPLPSGFGERAGEEVTFTIVVHEVKERILPDLDDNWVEENTEFESVADFRTELETQLGEAKRRAVERQFGDRALETLVDQVEIELPEPLIEAEMDEVLHRFLHRLEERELTLEDYLETTGTDSEAFATDVRLQAERALLTRLSLDAVGESEGLEVSAEERSAYVRALATQTDDPVGFMSQFQGSPQELSLVGDILRNKALQLVLSSAVAVDEEGNEIDIAGEEVEAEIVATDQTQVVAGEVVASLAEEEE